MGLVHRNGTDSDATLDSAHNTGTTGGAGGSSASCGGSRLGREGRSGGMADIEEAPPNLCSYYEALDRQGFDNLLVQVRDHKIEPLLTSR
jgi:hypothetical protein